MAAILRHPGGRGAWWLLVGGGALVLIRILVGDAAVGAIDLLGAASVGATVVGVVQLVAPARRGRDLDVIIDGAVVGFSLTTVAWLIVLGPRLAPATSPLASTLHTLYPVADVAALMLVLPVLVAGRSRDLAVWSLSFGLLAVSIADFARLMVSGGSGSPLSIALETGWLLGHVLVATAALVLAAAGDVGERMRQARDATAPTDRRPARRFGGARVGLLGLALAVAPLLALWEGARVEQLTLLVLGSAQLVLVVLVTVRLARAIGLTSRQLRDAEEMQQVLAHQATHDVLTGLANREHFAALHRLTLSVPPEPGRRRALLIVDLDNYKVVNETFGHHCGDAFIREVATRIRECLRHADSLARLGGDQFVILLDDVRDEHEAGLVAERIRYAVSRISDAVGQPIMVTATVGVALSAEDPADAVDGGFEGLLHRADAALADGKARGRDLIVFFDETLARGHGGQLALELELREALVRGELVLHYQPELELSTGDLFGVEALIRWQHPQRGLLPPGAFLEIAEQTGLMVAIGRFVIAESCAQAMRWRRRFGELAPAISINISPMQLAREDVAKVVRDELNRHGLPAHALRIEVTETAVMSEHPRILAQLDGLRHHGVEIAVDDFGTGYFSLSMLRSLHVDIIKIDRSFVMGIGTRTDDAIIHAVIDLARGLGMRTVAEGVETVEQERLLIAAGCDVGQGFLYSKAVPPDELDSLMVTMSERPARAHLYPSAAA